MESINDVKSIIYEFLPFKAKFAYAATETAVLSIHRAAKLTVCVKNHYSTDIVTLRRIYDTYEVSNKDSVESDLVNRKAMPLDNIRYDTQNMKLYQMISVKYVEELPMEFVDNFWRQQEEKHRGAGVTRHADVLESYIADNPECLEAYEELSNFADCLGNYYAPHILFAEDSNPSAEDSNPSAEDSNLSAEGANWFVVPKDQFINVAIADSDIFAIELLMKFYAVTGTTFTIDKCNYNRIHDVVTKYIQVSVMGSTFTTNDVPFDQFIHIFLCSMANNAKEVSILKEVIMEMIEYLFNIQLPQLMHLVELYDGIDYEISKEFLKRYFNYTNEDIRAQIETLTPINAPNTFIQAYNRQDQKMLRMLKLNYTGQIRVFIYAIRNKKVELIRLLMITNRELYRDDRVFEAALSAASFDIMQLLFNLGQSPQSRLTNPYYALTKEDPPMVCDKELQFLEFDSLFRTGVYNRAAEFESRAIEALYIKCSKMI